MARPTKLNEAVQTRICNALRGGNTRAAAAEYGGIAESTFYEWLKRGQEPTRTRKGAVAKADEGFPEFAEAVTRAEADCEVRCVALIQKAAGDREVKTTKRTSRQMMVGRGEKQRKVTLVEETTTTHVEFDWRAAAWWLERRNPAEWKRTEGRELTGKDGGPVAVEAVTSIVFNTPEAGTAGDPDAD